MMRRIVPWIGAGLVLLGLAAAVVLGLTVPRSALAPLGLVPIVVGAALLLVGASRALDARASHAAAAGLPTDATTSLQSGADPRRRPRVLLAALSTGVGIATVVAAVVAVVPVVTSVDDGQTLAVGLQDIGPDGSPVPDPSASATPDPTTAPDPSGIPIHQVLDGGDTATMNCGVALGGGPDEQCWSWTFTAPQACTAKVTIGFGDAAAAEPDHTITRFVSLSPDVPLSLAVHGTGATAGIVDTACVRGGDAPQPSTVDYPDQDLPDGDFPAACDDWGCDGFLFETWMDCPAATVEVAVDDDVDGHLSRNYAIVEEVRSSSFETPNEVFVPWRDGKQPASDEITSVTCED